MVCANWILTVFALATFVFVVAPGILGASATQWVVAIIAILTVIVSWTMVDCRVCKNMKKGKK